jgi:glycosyltransferase involved in cell wall biosynthesis
LFGVSIQIHRDLTALGLVYYSWKLPMRVAIIHYWLIGMRGGEKVLEALCEIYPEADIYTHVYMPEAVSDIIKSHHISTTFIQKLPFATRLYKHYLPLMPMALEALDLRQYDLVISSEAGPAKGVVVRPDAIHICYCHSPMRYIWDQAHEYKEHAGQLTKAAIALLMPSLRLWDYASAARVDQFIANSSFVGSRIWKYYRRSSEVIYPPVDLNSFEIGNGEGAYYLAFGQLVRYKRFDLAVESFNRLRLPLVIAGVGEEEKRLRSLAGDTVKFLGKQSAVELKELLRRCKALIFPGQEDFGIVPLEAMASGRPVIAYGAGGALETVVDGKTGLLFREQNSASLEEAVLQFEATYSHFVSQDLRSHAETFGKDVFLSKFRKITDEICAEGQARRI